MMRHILAAVIGLVWLASPSAGFAEFTDETPIAAVQSAAQSGDAAAQYELGLRHLEGQSVLQNYAQGVVWLERASAQNHHAAQNMLGKLYFEGLGVDKNPATAIALLRQAVQGGDGQFLTDLAVVLEAAQSPAAFAEAATLYEQAMAAGNTDAAVNLGVLYQDGKGVAQDYDRARQLYEGPAAAGHAKAQNNLGLLYVRGTGVAQDYERAAAFFQQAADQGMRVAIRNLGVMYANGFGVPLDEALADDLFRQAGQGAKAAVADDAPLIQYDERLVPLAPSEAGLAALETGANAGDPVAQFQAGWMLLQSETVSFAAKKQAALLFQSSANRGFGPAMRNLGVMYFQGAGLPQDFVLGYMWLILAQATGLDISAQLAIFEHGLTARLKTDAQAMALAKSKSLKSP